MGLPKARVLHQAGHFGEWLQGRLGPEGPVALVSLPCPHPVLQVSYLPGQGPLRVQGAGLSTGRARRFLRALGCTLVGHVRLRALVPPGQGMGVSTASLVALARLAGVCGPDPALVRACLRSEGASDPIWLDQPERVLWASREGRSLQPLPPLPGYQIIGGLWGHGQRTDPRDTRFPDISDLVADWAQARDLAEFAALATLSAKRCLNLRGRADDPTAQLAARVGALGWVAAHTGSARGLIFAPGTLPQGAAAEMRAAGFRNLVTFRAGSDQTD
ncbi:MAG: threonine kinase [Roseibaca calidilacus]|uniref:Threonine kinase n=1 Tax=Roseibaca calidilacus TaxID=1666912 RepID=A0A0P7VSF7_9RHOB|nr:hypothetical protein [Roseibaca calidilacus]KPP89807.1 MAG: threonine kinase [Roseibaca calidilacus]CUX80792.1 threonine kinase [Roseibaca calidilacus]